MVIPVNKLEEFLDECFLVTQSDYQNRWEIEKEHLTTKRKYKFTYLNTTADAESDGLYWRTINTNKLNDKQTVFDAFYSWEKIVSLMDEKTKNKFIQ